MFTPPNAHTLKAYYKSSTNQSPNLMFRKIAFKHSGMNQNLFKNGGMIN